MNNYLKVINNNNNNNNNAFKVFIIINNINPNKINHIIKMNTTNIVF